MFSLSPHWALTKEESIENNEAGHGQKQGEITAHCKILSLARIPSLYEHTWFPLNDKGFYSILISILVVQLLKEQFED